MITLERVCAMIGGLQRSELERWIAEDWVQPDRRGDEPVFDEIDVARVRLIVDLRRDLQLDEEALPVVLSLIDQLYAARRRMRLLCRAIEEAGSDELTHVVLRRFSEQAGPAGAPGEPPRAG